MTAVAKGTGLITPVDEAKRFMIDCFQAVGTPHKHAVIVANNLIEADYRGHYSHGMNRLEMYLRDIQLGTTDAKAEPVLLKETAATALLDGKNGLGAVIGERCMDVAIRKAKDVGVGLAVVRGSNHYGLAGRFGLQAIDEGFVGLSFTNTSPLMTPTGAKESALGTNPLTIGAPGLNGDHFLLDIATTAVAVGKIELAARKGEPIPKGWAVNDKGLPETDPKIAFKYKKLMPLGGLAETSGYKGYGLAMLVEIMSGILSGSSYGPRIRPRDKPGSVANLGHSFIAIDPNVFEPGFAERLSDLMGHLRKMEPVDPRRPVLVHGDMERQHMAKVNKDGGLKYVENQHKTNQKLAEEFKVKPMVSNSARVHFQSTRLITPLDEAKRFMIDCFEAVGTPHNHAVTVANNLIEADYRGHYSHGMNRLEMYLRDIQLGTTDAKVEPVLLKETAATALLDGKNGLGAVVGERCMGIAIRKARDCGVGFAVVRGSNHYGIAGQYALQALNEGLLGLSFTNTSPFMTPTRAKECALGTNPLALGAPGLKGDYFLLDMATTAVAVGKAKIIIMEHNYCLPSTSADATVRETKIELATRKQQPIPPGWALNDKGLPETDPNIAFKHRKLMPLGGSEENSGYKGYGLGMLVEILSGILSGSSYGPGIRSWGTSKSFANLGQCYIAIDPNAFEPGFAERLSDLMGHLRTMEPVDHTKPVFVHGDKEKEHMAKVHKDGGLEYVENQHKTNQKLAEEFKVKPMVSNSVLEHCTCKYGHQ